MLIKASVDDGRYYGAVRTSIDSTVENQLLASHSRGVFRSACCLMIHGHAHNCNGTWMCSLSTFSHREVNYIKVSIQHYLR